METVYIETTIISLLVADPSRDLATAGHQGTTRDWWQLRRVIFQCVTSEETLAEVARGDEAQARKRLEAPAGMPVLPITVAVEHLATEFLRTGSLPAVARSDAVHLAAATCAEVDFLLTWNCRHLANAQILRRLKREADRFGWKLPTVCTLLELMGDSTYDDESNS